MATKNNVWEHVLVPKHTKMSEQEVQKLLDKYNLTLKQLPKIQRNDPAIQNLDVKPGDVIKIERNSQTVGDVDFYRMVSNA